MNHELTALTPEAAADLDAFANRYCHDIRSLAAGDSRVQDEPA